MLPDIAKTGTVMYSVNKRAIRKNLNGVEVQAIDLILISLLGVML